MKTFKVELNINLDTDNEEHDVEMTLYRMGMKHFPCSWWIGETISVEDAEE